MEADHSMWFVLTILDMDMSNQGWFWDWASSKDSVEIYRRLGSTLQRPLDAAHLFMALNALLVLAINPLYFQNSARAGNSPMDCSLLIEDLTLEQKSTEPLPTAQVEANLLSGFDLMIRGLSAHKADVIWKHYVLALHALYSKEQMRSIFHLYNTERLHAWAEHTVPETPFPETQTLTANNYWLKRWTDASGHQESLDWALTFENGG